MFVKLCLLASVMNGYLASCSQTINLTWHKRYTNVNDTTVNSCHLKSCFAIHSVNRAPDILVDVLNMSSLHIVYRYLKCVTCTMCMFIHHYQHLH